MQTPTEERIIIMRKMTGMAWLTCLLIGSTILASPTDKKPGKVTGWVIDSACAFTKGLNKPISADCAAACAKNGSPLVLLQDNGTVVWPISGGTPASGQNDRLLPFAGKRVTVQGKQFVRGGSQAMVIEKIEEARTNDAPRK